MQSRIQELKRDIAELEELETKAIRRAVREILNIETIKLKNKLQQLESEFYSNIPSSSSTTNTNQNRSYEVKLTNYAWDQSDKFVKFYVTISKAHTLPAENISCVFKEKSLELRVANLDNKISVLPISNLLHSIVPEKSNWKVKTDMIIISAAKSENIKWDFVTEAEKRSSEAKKPPSMDTDENKDPSEMLMNIMKNTYEHGDDEMKRTIAKAWYESQRKGPAV